MTEAIAKATEAKMKGAVAKPPTPVVNPNSATAAKVAKASEDAKAKTEAKTVANVSGAEVAAAKSETDATIAKENAAKVEASAVDAKTKAKAHADALDAEVKATNAKTEAEKKKPDTAKVVVDHAEVKTNASKLPSKKPIEGVDKTAKGSNAIRVLHPDTIDRDRIKKLMAQ